MTRAPVTLTRQAKLLLTALGLIILLGGWLFWNNTHQNQEAEQPVPAPTQVSASQTTDSSGTSETGTVDTASTSSKATTTKTSTTVQKGTAGNATTDSGAAGQAKVGVTTTDGKTDVITAPSFPVTDPNGSTPDPTVVAAAPSGINPDQPLNGLNGHNPFRPIKLDPKTTDSVAAAPVNTPTASPVTISRPSSSAAQINSALAGSAGSSALGGAIPVPQIPTTATVPSWNSGRPERRTSASQPSSGALPVPTIPGASEAAATQHTAQPSASAVSGKAPSRTVAVPSIGQGNTVAVVDATPTAPPVTGVSVPSIAVDAGRAPSSAVTAPDTVLATKPGTANPQVMTNLEQDTAAATGTPAASSTTNLDSTISQRQLVFDAAVLGPVNTAVFRSDQGYIVLSVGQNVPGTNIVLKDVTATSATLSAGNTTKTLQLNQR